MSKGIGYTDSIVVYRRTGSGEIGDEVTWHGTLLEKVRVELRESQQVNLTGSHEANTCTIKIHDEDMPAGFMLQSFDKTNGFFVIAKKSDIGIDREVETGDIEDSQYDGGYFEEISKEGWVYKINTIEHYGLIPHWHIGGS